MNNDFWVTHEVICQWFSLVTSSLVKIIGKSPHSWPKHHYSRQLMHYSLYHNGLRWLLQDLTDDKSTLVQVMAWCRQAPSHYLSQCWLRSMSPHGVTLPQWVNVLNTHMGDLLILRLHWYVDGDHMVFGGSKQHVGLLQTSEGEPCDGVRSLVNHSLFTVPGNERKHWASKN